MGQSHSSSNKINLVKLIGVNGSQVTRHSDLPDPIKKLLGQLYLRGPSTVGIFRKSPNAKHCKELRRIFEQQLASAASTTTSPSSSSSSSAHIQRAHHQLQLNLQQQQHFACVVEQFQVTVVASVFKEWLRSLPDCLLMSSLYHEWIDVAKLIEPIYATKHALVERHYECLRIIRQLLAALNQTNLILLRSFICVLWHIASHSEHNKMSASNLGVCVGQSLLNNDQQHNKHNKSSPTSFVKRPRRTSLSHCRSTSTLSLYGSPQANFFFDPNDAQETAKYVPILIAFMIENATSLFGQDITTIFEDSIPRSCILDDSCEEVPQRLDQHHQIDCSQTIKAHSLNSGENIPPQFKRQHIVVGTKFRFDNEITSNPWFESSHNHIIATDDSNVTTSILIVNSPRRNYTSEAQQRPLSATESTSSSQGSSGFYSESPTFSAQTEPHSNKELLYMYTESDRIHD